MLECTNVIISQGCCYNAILLQNTAPVLLGMLLFCTIMVKYGTRPVRDVVILQKYGKIRHPSSQGCCYIAVLWLKYGTCLVRDFVIFGIMVK